MERITERRVTALIGPRRFGKTSVLRRVAHGLTEMSVIWVDLYEVTSMIDLAIRFDEALAAAELEIGDQSGPWPPRCSSTSASPRWSCRAHPETGCRGELRSMLVSGCSMRETCCVTGVLTGDRPLGGRLDPADPADLRARDERMALNVGALNAGAKAGSGRSAPRSASLQDAELVV